MDLLILKKFNNYFNRIIVEYNTLAKYQERSDSYVVFTGVNFDYNDGVTTELVIGSTGQQISGAPIDWDQSGCPDYLVCYETVNNAVVIRHRWFIIESKKNRLGQYTLSLKRDSIADHIEEVTDATCFIEKGIVKSKDDSAIYNKEDITTNQIKTDEFLLKDETQCGWVVGYVAKQSTGGINGISGNIVVKDTSFAEQTIPGPEASDSAATEVYANEAAFWSAHPEISGNFAILNSWAASVQLDIFYGKLFSYYKVGQTITCYNNGNISYQESAFKNNLYLHSVDQGGLTMIWKAWIGDWRENLANHLVAGWKTAAFRTNILNQLSAKENILFVDNSRLQSLFNYIKGNPTIKIGSKFYKPYDIYSDAGDSTVSNSSFVTVGSNCYDLLYNGLDLTPAGIGGDDRIEGTPGPETFSLEYSYNKHALGLREIFSQCKAKLPASVPLLKDAPYYMFAIPYSDDLALYSGNTLHCVTNKSVAISAAQALASNAGAGAVYDVQLLPYCPVRDIISTEKHTASSTVSYGTYDDMYFLGEDSRVNWYVEPKINHKYVINKTASVFETLRTTRRGECIKSSSVIKVSIGSDLEHPTTTYDAKRIEIRLEDLSNTESDISVYIYSDENGQNLLYSTKINSYASSSSYICLYATDIISVGRYYIDTEDPDSATWVYQLCKNGEHQPEVGGIIFGVWINTDYLQDYIYFEDYYTSKIDINKAITSDIVTMVDGTEADIVSTIFWCTESKFSFNKFMDNYFLMQSDGSYKKDEITPLINEHVKEGSSIEEIKVRNQVEMMRLAAPNYSSFFDINVQRNNGVEYIDVDCTYKPYVPYIHLNPNFKGLYGSDYNDPRGLICGGDYSIAITNDAWATYQLQNKNYQNIFDRQVQQLEVQHQIQSESDVWNAVAGVGVGAIGGALTGAKVGGVYGAIAGAVVGGVGSAVGGAADVMNNQRMRELQISTMKDIHKYQLDKIKALPQGLAKTNYMTNNNKLFPYLEFYTCTPVEEQAVRDKLNYNGMTINRVGKISEFQTEQELPYIKAKVIRIDIKDDAHQVKDIADELATGVYLPKGD